MGDARRTADQMAVIRRLCYSGLDVRVVRVEVAQRLRRLVPADGWCW